MGLARWFYTNNERPLRLWEGGGSSRFERRSAAAAKDFDY